MGEGVVGSGMKFANAPTSLRERVWRVVYQAEMRAVAGIWR